MSERWYVISPWPDKMAAISEDPGGASGALAYVGREGRDKDADAALIAASPHLLQVADMVVAAAEHENPEPMLRAVRAARQAVAKARGEESNA